MQRTSYCTKPFLWKAFNMYIYLLNLMALSEEKINEIKKQLERLGPEEQKAKFQEILSTLSPEEREELTGGGGQQQCPFCLMVQGQIAVKKIYEDDICIAILDINPANKGHMLLFPKTHAPLLVAVDDADVGHMFKVANMLAKAVFEALGVEGTNILVANGPVAGQTAPHVLINIIPRKQGDKVSIGWQPEKVEEAEMEEIANKIIAKTQSIKKETVVIEQPKKIERFDEEDLRIP